jgi:hypothetical protein
LDGARLCCTITKRQPRAGDAHESVPVSAEIVHGLDVRRATGNGRARVQTVRPGSVPLLARWRYCASSRGDTVVEGWSRASRILMGRLQKWCCVAPLSFVPCSRGDGNVVGAVDLTVIG